MPALFPLFHGNWNALPSHQASPPNEAFKKKKKIHSGACALPFQRKSWLSPWLPLVQDENSQRKKKVFFYTAETSTSPNTF